MGRLKIARSVDTQGNAVVVFSKGVGSFSVRVHEHGERDEMAHQSDERDDRRVRRTTLTEFLARQG